MTQEEGSVKVTAHMLFPDQGKDRHCVLSGDKDCISS